VIPLPISPVTCHNIMIHPSQPPPPSISIPNPCLVNISRTVAPHLKTWIVSEPSHWGLSDDTRVWGFPSGGSPIIPNIHYFSWNWQYLWNRCTDSQRHVVWDSPHLPLSDNTWVSSFRATVRVLEAVE
jgi:hypothetical protein